MASRAQTFWLGRPWFIKAALHVIYSEEYGAGGNWWDEVHQWRREGRVDLEDEARAWAKACDWWLANYSVAEAVFKAFDARYQC